MSGCSFLPTCSSKSCIFSVRSLKVSSFSLIVASTSGKSLLNSFDNCFCPIGGTGAFLGVISMVLFLSSNTSVIGLEKSFIFGSEGKGSIDGSLLRSVEADCGVSDGMGGRGLEYKLVEGSAMEGKTGGVLLRGGKSSSLYLNGGGVLKGTVFGIHSSATPCQ